MTRKSFLIKFLGALGFTSISNQAVAQQKQNDPQFDKTTDCPEPFGYKCNWFAIKTIDTNAVLETLSFSVTIPANWKSGMQAAYGGENKGKWAFVTPPTEGWTFVVSVSLPYPVSPKHPTQSIGRKFDDLFTRLMRRFSEVQFFGSYRVVDFVAWARAQNGQVVRAFSYADGDCLENIGPQSEAEAELRFMDQSNIEPSEVPNKMFALAAQIDKTTEELVAKGYSRAAARLQVKSDFPIWSPNESDVLLLAELWGINPIKFTHCTTTASLGFAVKIPAELTQ